MDDTCAVCADNLEWVAYGACGHREVCSTCVARLRFICDDPRCCICKTESDVVFVTKALGDYTRMINDFSVLPSEPKEGRVGSYWFHESTGAFFDDVDHYRMIKAMCKLSCTVCDKMEEKSNDAPKRRGRFRNIGQLKGHLFHNHRLLMCSLCLEGRKVFICEQKLYTRSQLNQHISTGDSEVDGNESERGGFMGHPMCEFCRNPFYGDNELYTHMSTEHYTCFICQRLHPGQYEYFKNYDDLEIHFRQEHFLCEDESCLAKKFIVFPSEAEMKRHNTLEHGGRMSRSKRNAALQIPTSFRYRRGSEDHQRGRGQTFHRDFADDQLSMAIQASLDTVNADASNRNSSSSSSAQVVNGPHDGNDMDDIIQPLESLTTTDSEASSRYLQALGHNSRSAPLQETAFPPLATTASSSQQIQKHDPESSSTNSMAARLRGKSRNVNVSSSSRAWSTASRPSPSLAASVPSRQTISSNASQPTSSTGNGPNLTYANLAKGQNPGRAIATHGISSASPIPSRNIDSTSRISHSASVPNLVERGSVEVLASDFPPVSAVQVRKAPSTSQVLPKVEDVHVANKSLVEKIRAALDGEEEKYTAFKEISGHYRQGAVDTETYLDYVQHFGLLHLILDLARLLPDSEKQKELLDKYNASMRTSDCRENGRSYNILLQKDNVSKKGKGKSVDTVGSSQKNTLADNIMSSVRELQSNNKALDQDVEVLSKDGYRSGKGKPKVVNPAINKEQLVQHIPSESSLSSGSSQSLVDGGGGSKQRKKTSKFHRLRLGEDSTEAMLNLNGSEPEPDRLVKLQDSNENPALGLPVRGAWRKGGGQKLLF